MEVTVMGTLDEATNTDQGDLDQRLELTIT